MKCIKKEGMIKYWISLRAAGVNVTFTQLLGMKLRRTLSDDLVMAMLALTRLELGIEADLLEAHVLAGGRVRSVVMAAVKLKEY